MGELHRLLAGLTSGHMQIAFLAPLPGRPLVLSNYLAEKHKYGMIPYNAVDPHIYGSEPVEKRYDSRH
jgi:hypothetical protein